MATNPLNNMKTSVDNMLKKTNYRFGMKQAQDSKDIDTTKLWSDSETSLFVTAYAEGLIQSQWKS